MSALFQSYHPCKKINAEKGLFKNFFLELKKNFTCYDDRVLHLVTRVLTRFRVRSMNKRARFKFRPHKLPKRFALKGAKKAPVTLRGKLQLANPSH